MLFLEEEEGGEVVAFGGPHFLEKFAHVGELACIPDSVDQTGGGL